MIKINLSPYRMVGVRRNLEQRKEGEKAPSSIGVSQRSAQAFLADPSGIFNRLACMALATPPGHKIGDLVPEDLLSSVKKHYGEIAEIPIDEQPISVRAANVLDRAGVKTVGDLISLDCAQFLKMKYAGRKYLKELQEMLSDILREKRFVEPEAVAVAAPAPVKNIAEEIRNTLSTLTPREKQVIKMRYGFYPFRPFRSFAEVGKYFDVSGQRASQILAKALRKLRYPARSDRLKRVRRIVETAAEGLFENWLIVSWDQLAASLRSRGLLNKRDTEDLPGIIALLRNVFGKLNFARVRLGGDLWLCRDIEKVFEILSLYFETRNSPQQRAFWKIAEYQEYVQRQLEILISTGNIRRIFENHPRFTFIEEDDAFYARDDRVGATLDRIKNEIGSKGPMHRDKIRDLFGAVVPEYVRSCDEFVLVGMGTYDLAANHPELNDVPRPEVRRRSAVFAIVFAILRDSTQMLSPAEIYQRMTTDYSGYTWSRSAIELVLKHPHYKGFFISDGSRYGLAESK